MNGLKILSIWILAFSVFVAPISSAYAEEITYNASTLRASLMKKDIKILMEQNQVHQAKDKVDIARGALLPHLDLGATLGGILGGPTFLLSAVSFLFPFLFPSNWANLRLSKDLLQAEKVSYHLVGLNEYASAYSVYITILNDTDLRNVLDHQYKNLVSIRDWLIRQRDAIGTVSQQDIDNADAQAKLSYAKLSKMDELLIKERSFFAEMLAMKVGDTAVIVPEHVPESSMEAAPVERVLSMVQELAPESTQMEYLIAAAKENRWAKEFGFVSGGNLTLSPGSTNAFENLSLGIKFSFGFDTIPTIRLASDNIENMKLQKIQLSQAQQQLVVSTLGSIQEAKKQFEAAAKSEELFTSVYRDEFKKYSLGFSDIFRVIEANNNISLASTVKIEAMLDLDALRITLHRALLSDQFALIPKCLVKADAEKTEAARKKKKVPLTIDDVCDPSSGS